VRKVNQQELRMKTMSKHSLQQICIEIIPGKNQNTAQKEKET
jgi:hypothetical protein